MKKAIAALTILSVLALGAGTLRAQNAEDAKYKKFEDNLWDAYFKFFPTAGTIQGFAKYNDRLEDMGQGTIEKFLDSLDGFNQELVTKIDVTKVSPDVRIQIDMVRDFLDLTVLKLENSLFTVDNPLFYNDVFLNSIRSLIVRDSGSAAAAARAKLLPSLIKKAKDNLKNPPQEYTQAAIKQIPAVIDYYKTELPKTASSAPGLLAELSKVVPALEDYQRFLQGELLSRSTGNFRLGPEVHLKVLRMASQGSLPILEELVNRSKTDYSNIRKAMGQICLSYFSIMYPNVNVDQMATQRGVDQALSAVIQGVFDKIKPEHVQADQYFERIGQAVDKVRTFIQQHNLVNLPDENLQVLPMPSVDADGIWYRLSTPGAWEMTGPYTLYVQAIPAGWSAEQTTGFLEEHNNYYVDYMTVQRILPGLFAPAYFTRKASSPTVRMCANQALLYGWSVPLEETMVLAGYGNYDLRMRLNQLKLLLKNIIDFQMDINVHEGAYTKEKVVDYMTRGGFMTQTEAERRWNRIVLNPGLASLTYIGYQEVLDLEKAYRQLKGDAFSESEFLQKILSYGAIPLRALKAKLAQ